MIRGDIVTVALQGDYGKPRLALIVQAVTSLETHSSAIVCPITFTILPLDFRLTIPPSSRNGLRVVSQVTIDKIIAAPRAKLGCRVGSLDPTEMRQVNAALAFLLGLNETEDF
jgi:mRNA interferase MazF